MFGGSNRSLCDSHIAVPNHRISHAPQHKTVGMQTSSFDSSCPQLPSINLVVLGILGTARPNCGYICLHRRLQIGKLPLHEDLLETLNSTMPGVVLHTE